jgi:hypothetical protein
VFLRNIQGKSYPSWDIYRLYRKGGGIRSCRIGGLANQNQVWGVRRWDLGQANENWGPVNGKGPSRVSYIRARGPEKGNYKGPL